MQVRFTTYYVNDTRIISALSSLVLYRYLKSFRAQNNISIIWLQRAIRQDIFFLLVLQCNVRDQMSSLTEIVNI